jgi:hypothetical protein
MKNLSDEQSKQVRGGVGADLGGPGPGEGANGWGYPTPFNPSGNENAGLGKNFMPGVNENAAVLVYVPVKT